MCTALYSLLACISSLRRPGPLLKVVIDLSPILLGRGCQTSFSNNANVTNSLGQGLPDGVAIDAAVFVVAVVFVFWGQRFQSRHFFGVVVSLTPTQGQTKTWTTIVCIARILLLLLPLLPRIPLRCVCESRHGWHGCSVTYRWFLVGSFFVHCDVVRSLLEL